MRPVCRLTCRSWFNRQHRLTFSRLPPTHSAAGFTNRKQQNFPSSVTAMTCFFGRPPFGLPFGLYLSRFFQPFRLLRCPRLLINSFHFFPLFAGVCPFINRPVAGLRVGRGGGMYSSINLFFEARRRRVVALPCGKSIKTDEQPPPLTLLSLFFFVLDSYRQIRLDPRQQQRVAPLLVRASLYTRYRHDFLVGDFSVFAFPTLAQRLPCDAIDTHPLRHFQQ